MALGIPRLTLKRKLITTLVLTAVGAAGLAVLAMASLGSLAATTAEAQRLAGIYSSVGEARTMCLEMALGHRTAYSELLDRLLPALQDAQGGIGDPETREVMGQFIYMRLP